MSRPLIALVGFAYAYIAVESLVKNNWPMAVIYAGYAASNVGLWALAS